jgi:hypothetical protein
LLDENIVKKVGKTNATRETIQPMYQKEIKNITNIKQRL